MQETGEVNILINFQKIMTVQDEMLHAFTYKNCIVKILSRHYWRNFICKTFQSSRFILRENNTNIVFSHCKIIDKVIQYYIFINTNCIM